MSEETSNVYARLRVAVSVMAYKMNIHRIAEFVQVRSFDMLKAGDGYERVNIGGVDSRSGGSRDCNVHALTLNKL